MNDESKTSGLKAIQQSQDALDPKSWASLTALGPIIAGIAWAAAVYLGVPTGRTMIFGGGVFALFVVLAHIGKASKLELLAYWLAATMILFWQGALASIAGGEVAKAQQVAEEGEPVSWLIPEAHAESKPNTIDHYSVQRIGDTYEVRLYQLSELVEEWDVPVSVYNAINRFERSRRKGFGVKW